MLFSVSRLQYLQVKLQGTHFLPDYTVSHTKLLGTHFLPRLHGVTYQPFRHTFPTRLHGVTYQSFRHQTIARFLFYCFPYIKFQFSTVIQFSDPIFRRFSQNCEKRQLGSSCLFVRLYAWNKSASTGGIFMKLCTWGFFENPLTKLKFSLNCYKDKGTLHEDLCLISR